MKLLLGAVWAAWAAWFAEWQRDFRLSSGRKCFGEGRNQIWFKIGLAWGRSSALLECVFCTLTTILPISIMASDQLATRTQSKWNTFTLLFAFRFKRLTTLKPETQKKNNIENRFWCLFYAHNSKFILCLINFT